MMNGAKKSDSSIVPAKLANKAERLAAEFANALVRIGKARSRSQ
jgi:hypothetical protein